LLPGGQERWLALLKQEGRKLQVSPRLGNRSTITREELATLQPDRAYLLRQVKRTEGDTP
jgi:hypothetical protein